MGRNLTNLFISESFQYLTQISGSELQTGLGQTLTGSLAITSSKAETVYTQQTNANQNHYVAFVATTNDYETLETDNQLVYNPNSNLLTVTASYANIANSASYAVTASYALNAGTAVNTGSLLVTASAVNNIITFTKGDGSTFPVTVATGSTVSSSFASTASLALLNVLTASSTNATITYTKGDGTTFTNVINNVVNATSASFATSASQAVSASQAQTAVSSSFATSASVATSASFAVSASQAANATSASYAISASQAQNAVSASYYGGSVVSASYAATSSYATNFNVAGTLTALSASITYLTTVFETASVIYSSGSNQFGDASNDVQTLYGTVNILTGPLNVSGSATFYNGITGSLNGTASFATSASQAVSASYAFNATSASFATSASQATSASFATSASQAVSSSFATTASFALNVTPTNTGSLLTTASAAGNVITFTKGDASTFNVTVATGSAGVTIFTNPSGSNNAVGYADQFFNFDPIGSSTPFLSGSIIFAENITGSFLNNGVIIGGKNHTSNVIDGNFWAQINSGILGGENHSMFFSGSNNFIVGGKSNTLEAAGIQNSVLIGGQSNRLYATENSVMLGGTNLDARTASHRSAFIGGSGGTFDYLQDSAIIASNNTTFVGGTLNNVTVLSSRGISKNAVGTDITSSVVIAAVDGAQSNRNLNQPYTTYSENLWAFNSITLQSGSLSGSAITNVTDTYTTSPKVDKIVTLTQTEYNAIGSPDANTLYIISGSSPISTSGFATTGSNTFIGNQTISGSLTVTGSALFTNNIVFSGSVRGAVISGSTTSNTASLDFSTGNFFTLNTNNVLNTQITPTNVQAGQTVNLELTFPATASAITFPSYVKQPSGSAYSPSGANTTDILTFIVFNSGSVYLSSVKNMI